VCDFNTPAIDFNLKGVDLQIHTLDSCKGENGLLVMFICNHCPYVKAIPPNDTKVFGRSAVAGSNSRF
jgi:hypothetical protein